MEVKMVSGDFVYEVGKNGVTVIREVDDSVAYGILWYVVYKDNDKVPFARLNGRYVSEVRYAD